MRTKLIEYQGSLLTEDTIQAVLKLISKAFVWEVNLIGPGDWERQPLAMAGREVSIVLQSPGANDPRSLNDRQQALNAAWGYMVPLGFTPWLRYPVSGEDGEFRYHFLGPWKIIYERLIAEGRGHLAWPSMCCAAQCDVGTWTGDKTLERSIQAQLHRVGFNAGPIDGVIGPTTTAALNAAGLIGVKLKDALDRLCERDDGIPVHSTGHSVGHLAIPGQRLSLSAFGGVRAIQTVQGAAITVDGPGRLVIDVG
jgi:hypothetical protein